MLEGCEVRFSGAVEKGARLRLGKSQTIHDETGTVK
jgi:hypothetical protein